MHQFLTQYGILLGLLGEHYGKTPDEFIDMTLEDFTLAYNAWAMLMDLRQEADEKHRHEMEREHARRAMKQWT